MLIANAQVADTARIVCQEAVYPCAGIATSVSTAMSVLRFAVVKVAGAEVTVREETGRVCAALAGSVGIVAAVNSVPVMFWVI